MNGPLEMGFHGKLPSHGDFLRRRVSGDFLGTWDPWLQSGIYHARHRLGEGWLQAYLTSPIWRFLLAPGVCGAAPCLGILMPSVDAVGRYFPLTLVRPLPAATRLLDLPVRHDPWFAELEELALGALGVEDGTRLEAFDQALLELGARLPTLTTPALPAPSAGALHLRLTDLAEIDAGLRLHQQVQHAGAEGFSLWWTQGSERIAPCLILRPGLPPPEGFAALFDGEWLRHGWDSRSLHGAEATTPEPAYAPVPLRLSSAGLTNTGKVRTHNEDAYLDRPDIGLWAVADGVGGLAAGDMASRSVTEALQGVPPQGDLQERLNHARERLTSVNLALIKAAHHPSAPVNSASTVVVLLAGATECCWLWAGDSRVYRLREGQLERLSRDHSAVQEMVDRGELLPEQAEGHPRGNVITRAIGGTDALEIEARFAELRSGDRFLLCSDGVHGAIGESPLQAALDRDTPEDCVRMLLDAVLTTEARDNATAVAVFIH